MKDWDGKPRCWTCGWPDKQATTETPPEASHATQVRESAPPSAAPETDESRASSLNAYYADVHSAKWILGIDLGTCNSCMAVVMEGGEPVVIPNAEGRRVTPSIVALTADGRWLVGEPAKRQAVSNPTNTILSVKRLMGRKYDEVAAERKYLPYGIVRAANGDAHVKIGSRTYSPAEISSRILGKLKLDAEAFLGGEEITRAVITVPSYFNGCQRQATKDAARMAGLQVVRILNESTAACLAYGLDRKLDETVAVVHFGGGTFDVSVLNVLEDWFEVISTTGDTHLGGDDIDTRVVDWLVAQFKDECRIELTPDPTGRQRLREAAERAKCDLTTAHQAEIDIPFIGSTPSGPLHLKAVLTRDKLEALSAPVLDRMAGPAADALKECERKHRSSRLSHVVLAGAMTRMPKVQEVVGKLFGVEPCRGVHPEEVVAVGAAVQGGIFKGLVKDVLLLDVTPLSLGIETLGGVFTKMIERNTTIPTMKTDMFSTAADNQDSVDIHVFQGERAMAADNRAIGSFRLDGIPPAPRGVPQIEVTFDIDANGILHVSAKDLGTGRKQAVTIVASSGLTEEDIAAGQRESAAFSRAYRIAHGSSLVVPVPAETGETPARPEGKKTTTEGTVPPPER